MLFGTSYCLLSNLLLISVAALCLSVAVPILVPPVTLVCKCFCINCPNTLQTVVPWRNNVKAEGEKRRGKGDKTAAKCDIQWKTKKLTVLWMKSGLKCTLSPQRFISDGVGSFLDTKAVMDSLLPPLTTATKSSTALSCTVLSVERQIDYRFLPWAHVCEVIQRTSDKTRRLTSHLIQQALTASSFNPTWHINTIYVGPKPKAHLRTTVVVFQRIICSNKALLDVSPNPRTRS